MPRLLLLIVALLLSSLCSPPLQAAQELTPGQQGKIDTLLKEVQSWAMAEQVVAAVKGYNASHPAATQGMSNEKWTALPARDPIVRELAKNELASYLKSKTNEVVGEFFVSGADGGKVALSNKTTSWNHGGKAKHDVPMSGKTWQGQPELDQSTGWFELQVAAPVLDGTTPIGSLVVGLILTKLQ